MTACASSPAAGVVVATVQERTPAARAGLQAGDRIVAINGEALRDVIDFHFHAGHEQLRLSVERGGRKRSARLRRTGPLATMDARGTFRSPRPISSASPPPSSTLHAAAVRRLPKPRYRKASAKA